MIWLSVHIFDIDFTICDSSHRGHLLTVYCKVCGSPKDTGATGDALCGLCNWETPGEIPDAAYEAFTAPELVSQDTPIEKAIKYLNHLRSAGEVLHYITGRNDGRTRESTEFWLFEHAGRLSGEVVKMRRDDDMRAPAVIKKELLDELIVEEGLQDASLFFYDDDIKMIPVYTQYGIMLHSPECWEHLYTK